jgi:two-component system sensor kinase FixL
MLFSEYFENSKIEFRNLTERSICVGLHSGELQTVLINLIDNAIFWINAGKAENKLIQISSRLEDKDVIVTVSDTGTGVDESYGDTIFKPGVTAKPNGFGMGLVVVYEILAMHGGYLKNVHPGDLGGATFEFSLPIKG